MSERLPTTCLLDGFESMIYTYSSLGAGITQLAECQLPKLKVAGSNPVARSILTALTKIGAS